MQNNDHNYSRDNYINLIEYLKWNFLEGTLFSNRSFQEIERFKKNIDELFDIEVSEIQIKKTSWIKKYVVSEREKKWDFLIGSAALLFAHNMQFYRDQLISEEHIQGIVTLKKAFFEVSAFPAMVIVLGNDQPNKIWLTSASSSEDMFDIFSDIGTYKRNVYYTEKLDAKSFMPENYNGEKEIIDSALDKYETKTLKEIADVVLGKNVNRREIGDTGIHYLRQRDIQQGVIINPDTRVIEAAAEKYAKQLLQEGDLLLTKNFGQHKVAKVTSDNLPAIASNSLFIIRAFGVPEDYLYEYFTSNTGKAILDKQLSSIERGATVLSINMRDLKELRVPIFDPETMLAFSKIEDMKAADVIPVVNQISRLGIYAERLSTLQMESQVEEKVYGDFIKAGWSQKELQMNKRVFSKKLKAGTWIPDIALLNGEDWIGAVEIKSDFSRVPNGWIHKIGEVMGEKKIPCLILTTGFYYEVHYTHIPIVKKLTEAPTKELLLSILSGKECD